MKKGRPAHVVTALATPDRAQQVADVLLAHTSTLGVRTSAPLARRVLRRGWVSVDVDGHAVRIKVAGEPDTGVITQATPEFVDVEALAAALDVPQRVALTQAQAAAWDAGLKPGAPWPEVADA